jgi:hypothetical protein
VQNMYLWVLQEDKRVLCLGEEHLQLGEARGSRI